jgi:hypothetical protein
MTANDCLPVGHRRPASSGDPVPDVFIALPVYSQLMVEFTGSLMNALRSNLARVEFHAGDSLVTRARNNVVHTFLQTKIPWLLFLDTDLIFDADAIKRLLSWGPEYPLVGGCYPKKKVGPAEWVTNALPGVGPRPDGLQEVAEIGTGMLRVHRSVFAALREAYPQLRYQCDANRDIRYDFFPVGTWKTGDMAEARYLSEDWYICQLARAIGYRVYADTKVTARHVGVVAYPFPPPEAPKPVETPVNGNVAPVVENAVNTPPPAPASNEPVVPAANAA